MTEFARATAITAWRHVKFGYDGETPPWVLREVPGKGLAAFATRRFELGELICTESPTIWVPGHHPFSAEQLEDIARRVARLDAADRSALLAMANVFPEAPLPAAGIFMTNSFDMTDSPSGVACAMYCALARLNHSCTPNAQQTHLPDSGDEVLHASRTILEGEEINDCYIELRQCTAQRRAALQEVYRFECECPACGAAQGSPADPTAAANAAERTSDDARRVRALQLDDSILAAASDQSPAAALDIALDAVRLLTSHACAKWSTRYVADAHCTVYQLAMALGKCELALQHGREAYRINCLLQGPHSPVSIGLKKKLKKYVM